MSSRLTACLVVALSLAVVPVAGCDGDRPPPAAPRREIVAQWQDVFDGTPELYVVVRPQAIKRDAVYGSLFKSVLRMAQARTEMGGVTALEAAEGCEQIVVGMRRDAQTGDKEAVIVFQGVPASLDPAKMNDPSGHPLFRVVDERTKVREYEKLDRRSAGGGSVFVLPERTWVVTSGAARARARQAFAVPFGRPAPSLDADALATVRLDAATFLAAPAQRSAALAPLSRKLVAVTLALKPGKGGVVATLQYEDEDASAWAEMHTKRVIEEVVGAEASAGAAPRPGGRVPERRFSLGWLKDAKVGHQGNAVTVTLPIPARLLEELPLASGADLPL